MIGALLMVMLVAQPPPTYPSALDLREIKHLIRAADRDFAGVDVEREPDATRAALAKHVGRMLDEARRRGLAYEYAESARRDVEAGPPVPRPGIPMPIDGRMAKLSYHAAELVKLLGPRPRARP